MSRPRDAVKLTSHLAFSVWRSRPTCLVCHELMPSGEPLCERCGLGAFHLGCYIAAIAREPVERRFWSTTSARVSEALAPFAPFLCPGCRS